MTKGICSFCGSTASRWIHPCTTFALVFHKKGHTAYFVSHGFWYACNECHDLIVAGNWELLGLRALESMTDWRVLFPQQAIDILEKIEELHNAFRIHAYGTPYVQLTDD